MAAAVVNERESFRGTGLRLVSVTERVERTVGSELFASARRAGLAADYFESKGSAALLVGIGVAVRLNAEHGGADRFEVMRAGWRQLFATALAEAEGTGRGPLLLGGFAFDPAGPSGMTWEGFGTAQFTLPRLLYRQEGDEAWLTASVFASSRAVAERDLRLTRDLWHWLLGRIRERRAEEMEEGRYREWTGRQPRMLGGMPVVMEEAPTVKEWQDLITQAAGAVNMGLFEKVVLARSVMVPETALVDASVALGRLSTEVDDGVVFAFTRSGHCFLGATPERLVRLWGGKVETAALAGSVARTGIEEDDARLAAELLKDVKNRWEHEIVVRAIVQALVSAGVRVGPVAEPVVMQTAAVQHLYTPIVGETARGMTALDLVERLHPTPATGGEPAEAALNWLREHEGLDRGWYAAPVGWIDGLGNGEFAVALRSGVLTAQRATLFAGCGIVAGSDPRKELAESETKFQPMLRAIVRRGGE